MKYTEEEQQEYLRRAAEYDKAAADYTKPQADYAKMETLHSEHLDFMNRVDVSIVVLTHNYPAVFSRLLDSLRIATQKVPYELIIVDNGSGRESVDLLKQYHKQKALTKLILEPINHFFSEGNNIGVRNSDPSSKYILLLNSDVEILHPLWLLRILEWMEGIPETYLAHTWSTSPTHPTPGPRDIVSVGWSYAEYVPGSARPEGWCCMIRRKWWKELSPDFPFYHGFEEMIADRLHQGAKAGVLFNYSRYLRHYEGGCEAWKRKHEIVNKRQPDERKWFKGAPPVETLDFTLGPNEHRSYMEW